MEHVVRLFEVHGVLAVFIGVFIEQLGAPIPAVPFLLLAGAQGAGKPIFLAQALLAATIASVVADVLWFYAGRRFGRSVLGLLCRVSVSPDTCVRKTEWSFTQRGASTILLSKFIPGVSTVARPLAGAMGMSMRTFMLLNLAGTLLWAGSGIAAGVVLRSEVKLAVRALEGLGDAALLVVIAALLLYVGWRTTRRLAVRRMLRRLPRVEAGTLAELASRGEDIVVVDVRPRESSDRARVAGAVQAPLGSDAFDLLPDIVGRSVLVTYCDCPGDATAAKAAMMLAKRGYQAQVLAGGVTSWMQAGLPLEGDTFSFARTETARTFA